MRTRVILSALSAMTALYGWTAPSAAESLSALASPGRSDNYIRPDDYRVAQVGYRLALAGAALCSNSYPLTGLYLHQLGDYYPADRQVMIDTYGLDLGPGALAVVADSPAARAGLAAGDVLLAVNSIPFRSPAQVATERDRSGGGRSSMEAVEAQLEAELRKGPARLDLMRAGNRLSVTLAPVPGCPARVRLARSNQSNAFADDRYAIVTTKLLEFLRSDEELAIVLAHELAHNILGHPARLREQKVPRGLLRGVGKNAKRVWATEEEADRLSVRLLRAAGYDLGAVLPFWRRFYAKHDWAPQIFRTHPSLAARERIFTEAMAELPAEARPHP